MSGSERQFDFGVSATVGCVYDGIGAAIEGARPLTVSKAFPRLEKFGRAVSPSDPKSETAHVDPGVRAA